MGKIIELLNLPIEYSEEKVNEFYKTIKPIMRFKDTPYYLLDVDEIERTWIGYTWIGEDCKDQEVDMTNLCILKEVNTLHRNFVNHILLPTFREIVSQIPEEILEKVAAFEVIKKYEELDENVYRYKFFFFEWINVDFRIATVKLYGKKI